MIAVETAIAWYTSCYAMARGHCLNILVVLAGGPRPLRSSGSGRAVEPSLFLSPPPPHSLPSPSLISHLTSVDVKQNVYVLTY